MESPLVTDIRRVAHKVVDGPWQEEGVGNRLSEGGFELFVQPQGYPQPFEVIVGIVKSGPENGKPVLWYRQLNRDGTWKDEDGNCYTLDTNPEPWLSVVLIAAREEQLRLIAGES